MSKTITTESDVRTQHVKGKQI